VLGPRLGDVPVVIPLMWFALTYVAYVIANLIVWQAPSDGGAPPLQAAVMSLLAAMIVTAYDLGADPYMVYVLKAWIMAKKDGWWFGETLQGFVGWMLVSFVIVYGFRRWTRDEPPRALLPVTRLHALVPLLVYGGNMLFQAFLGYPVETRTVAVFAMGIPLLTALCGFVRWHHPVHAAEPQPAAMATASTHMNGEPAREAA
jgi:putative membrane protein